MAHPLEWVPVGSILSYTTDELWRLPTIDWAVCEGQQLLASDWPELFHAIGYTNGGKDGVNQLDGRRSTRSTTHYLLTDTSREYQALAAPMPR